MERIIVKHPDGSSLRLFGKEGYVRVTNGKQKKKLLGENIVELTVRSGRKLDFYIGDKITVFAEDYFLNLLPEAKKTSTREFEYQLTFESVQYDLAKVVFLDEDGSGLSTSSEFTLRANIEEIGRIIINNLNRVYGSGKWILLETPDQTTEVRDFSFSDDNCLAVLQKACQEYGTEFKIETVQVEGGYVYQLSIKPIGRVIDIDFEYGHNKGLYGIKRKTIDSANIVTRLYAFGGNQNLPANYRNHSSRLRLPDTLGNNKSYIEDDDAIAAFGLVEGSKLFEDIWPKYEGTVTAIDAQDPRIFLDSAFPFDLNETDSSGNTKYLIDGTSAKITFNTGALAGYTFEVGSYDHTTKTFKILKYEDERGFVYPSVDTATFRIGVGDSYALSDIYPPQAYIDAAEDQLLAAAQEYLNENKAPRVQYEIDLAEEYIAKIVGDPRIIINLFNTGDYIGIKDDEIGIDRTGEASIRITEFTRDLCSPTHYSYTLAVSDTVEVSIIERLISDHKRTNSIIDLNDLSDPSKLKSSWRSTQELLNMVFDQEGYFDAGNIKPLSITTKMLSVGAKAQQFTLRNTVIEANYNGDSNQVKINGGSLLHYGLNDENTPSWNISSTTITLTSSGSYYIYVRCLKSGNTADVVFSADQYQVEEGNYYYFLVGTLHSIDANNTRAVSLTYGFSTINGRFIRTGRISSADGSCYFDLDNNEIHGTISFTKDGQDKSIEDLDTESSSSYNYITNVLPGVLQGIYDQLDGVIETWFGEVEPTLNNAPASSWTTTTEKDNHLGDLYYDTISGYGYRFGKTGSTYKWTKLTDSGVTEALAAAARAQDTADGKRRVFVNTPYTPYDEGDLWVNGTDIKVCKTARATGSYLSSDWKLGSDYTNDDGLNSFIDGAFADLCDQVDGKIESWFTTSDPASSWATTAEKRKHIGDLWYNTSTKRLKRYANTSGSTYGWQTIEDAAAIAAAEAASQAQDTADGKRTVFTSTPYTPYYVGDLWVNGTDIKVCNTERLTGSYAASDWGLASNYDHTKTVIDGGLITSGTIQLAGSSNYILAGITGQGTAGTSVRIWAGATFDSRGVAPFRVTQNGELFGRYRIELQDAQNNGLAGICGQGTDGSDSGIRFWAGATYDNRGSAPFRVKADGEVHFDKATFVSGCKIGNWEVTGSGITDENGGYLVGRKSYGDGHYTESRLGIEAFPAYSGVTGCGYFENTRVESLGTNYGVYINVANAAYNIALGVSSGDSIFNGLMVSRKLSVVKAVANSFVELAYDSQVQLIDCKVDTCILKLPRRTSVASHLGISSSTYFAVPLTIVGKYQTSGAKEFAVIGRSESYTQTNNSYYPYRLDNNASKQSGYMAMDEGDVCTFQLVYNENGYFAYEIQHRS